MLQGFIESLVAPRVGPQFWDSLTAFEGGHRFHATVSIVLAVGRVMYASSTVFSTLHDCPIYWDHL